MSMACSGISARWCPVHGDCICQAAEENDLPDLNHTDCPLHGTATDHGDMWEEQLRVERVADRLKRPAGPAMDWGPLKRLFGGEQ